MISSAASHAPIPGSKSTNTHAHYQPSMSSKKKVKDKDKETVTVTNKNPLKYYSVCSWRDPEDLRIFPEELCDVKLFLKLVQNKSDKGAPVITYNLILKNESKEGSGAVKVPSSSAPVTVKILKEEIEEQHNVPITQQKLSFKGKSLGDERAKLDNIGIKPDNTIEVAYVCEAEVQKVKRVMKWLDYMSDYLYLRHPLTSTELPQEAELLATMGLNERLLQRLATNYFSPHDIPRVKANKEYFLRNNGLNKLIRLLGIITEVPWGQEVIHMKLLEPPLLDSLRMFATGNNDYMKELVECEVHHYVVMMMTRVRLIPFGPVEDMMGSAGVKKHNDILVRDMISSAVELMWTMKKCDEIFTDMTNYYVCAENLVFLSVSPSVTNRQACLSIYLVLIRLVRADCLRDLGQASLIYLEAPSIRKTFGESSEEIIVIKYLCAVSVAWKYLHNTNYVRPAFASDECQLRSTLEMMEDFLATCPHDVIVSMVERYGLKVHNLLIMFDLFFNPRDHSNLIPKHPEGLLREMDVASAKCMMRHFQVMVLDESMRDELRSRSTDQRVACFPWWLAEEIEEDAKNMVRFLHSFKPLPVPKLSIIARTRLSRP